MKKRYPFLSKNWLRFGLAAALTVSSLSADAQTAPAIQWDKTFGGSDNDRLTSLQQTSDGGYILGGTSQSGISGDKSQASKGGDDYWVVKLDASGNKVWDKTFGGSNGDFLRILQQTYDGGYILGGHSNSGISGDKSQTSQGDFDYWIIKLDAAGNKLWDKTYGGNNVEEIWTLQQTSDGGYLLGGVSYSGISGDKSQVNRGSGDYWIVKLDASGNKLWDKTIGGNNDDVLYSLRQTSDGGCILGGRSSSGVSGDKSQANKGGIDYWVVKLDASGNKLWDKTIGGSASDNLVSIQQTLDGGYILGGTSNSGISGDKSQSNKGGVDFWVVKLDASGNKLWDKTIGGNNDDALLSLQQTFEGGYILGGTSDSGVSSDKSQASKGNRDYWVVKLDASGEKLWDKTIGGNDSDGLNSICQTSDGGYFLGGQSSSDISGDKSQICQGGFDYWIVKLGADITGTSESFSNSQITISPNPSQGKFNLQLENIAASKVEVYVLDVLGRVMLQKELPVANKQVSEALEIKAAKGMYLLQVKAGNQITSRKIVVE